eukprot:INCI7493.3.p1 GENE.INCI7493.3~~INCI7493.3.p1  ORF type:complete len:323 (-),score=61.75 INCI7493.3:422-1390(-)
MRRGLLLCGIFAVALQLPVHTVTASWFSSFFGSDLGQGVGKPETNDPTKLQEQIDILIHDQRKHDPDSAAWHQADLAIMMRRRRIRNARYLDEGMSEEDFEKLNDIQDELIPLKEKLRSDAAEKTGSATNFEEGTPNHARMLELNEQVRQLTAPYGSARGRRLGWPQRDKRFGFNKAQQERVQELRKQIQGEADMVKISKLRDKLNAIFEGAKVTRSVNPALKKLGRRNHTLAKKRHLELTQLREDLHDAETLGHTDRIASISAKLKAATEFYTKAEAAERAERAEVQREIARISVLLDQVGRQHSHDSSIFFGICVCQETV